MTINRPEVIPPQAVADAIIFTSGVDVAIFNDVELTALEDYQDETLKLNGIDPDADGNEQKKQDMNLTFPDLANYVMEVSLLTNPEIY